MIAKGTAGVGDEPIARFELTRFLEGRTEAWGIFEDRFGTVRQRFHVEMLGVWRGAVFELREAFHYASGETETRVWRVAPSGAGRFVATCPDCIGEARGESDADSVRMRYRFRLKLARRSLVVDFDDRLFRVGAQSAVNRAVMRKWGIRLGELSLFFQRCDSEAVLPFSPTAAAA
jgi:hypothetical protein